MQRPPGKELRSASKPEPVSPPPGRREQQYTGYLHALFSIRCLTFSFSAHSASQAATIHIKRGRVPLDPTSPFSLCKKLVEKCVNDQRSGSFGVATLWNAFDL